MSGNTSPSDTRNAAAAPASYQPRDRIQVQPGMPFIPPAGPGRPLYPQAVPAAPGWHKRQGRWREYGVLVGLWLLVMLVAAAVVFRFLDLSAEAARPDQYGRADAAPASSASQAALPASRMAADDDPFDDTLPVLPPPASPAPMPTSVSTSAPMSAPVPVPGPTPMPAPVPAPAPVLAPAAPAPAALPAVGAVSVASRTSSACPPALAAMQLCGTTGK